jgi:hypothetical protein
MSPTKTYDAQAAELVTRTLAAVAGATDVADEERISGSDRVARLDTLPLPPRGGRHRRVLRAAIGLSAAAAAAVAAFVVVRDDPSDVTTGPTREGEESAPPVPHTRWLPDGFAETAGPQPVGDIDLEVEAVVVGVPGGSEVLVASVTHEDGRAVESYEADWVVDRLTGVFGISDDEAVVHVADGDGRAFVAVPRGGLASEEVDAIVAYMATVAPFGPGTAPSEGMTVDPVRVDWAPGLAPTRSQAFASGDEGVVSLEVYFVAGQLPDEAQLDLLLGGVDEQPVGDVIGWRWRPESSDQEVLLWQEAPGTIGSVVAGGLSPDEVVHVAESVEPNPTPPILIWEIGRSNEGADVEYSVEWAEAWPEIWSGEADEPDLTEGPCARLEVAGEALAPVCGLDDPAATYVTFDPAAIGESQDLYWGIVGPSVATVELDQSGDPPVSAEALPLNRGDPDSMRYVVITAPHPDVGTTTARFLDGGGNVLDTKTSFGTAGAVRLPGA